MATSLAEWKIVLVAMEAAVGDGRKHEERPGRKNISNAIHQHMIHAWLGRYSGSVFCCSAPGGWGSGGLSAGSSICFEDQFHGVPGTVVRLLQYANVSFKDVMHLGQAFGKLFWLIADVLL